jgi:hypothetical protein
MAEVAQNTSSEFWRAPVGAAEVVPSAPVLADVCPSCKSEFVVGAAFCHACGAQRASDSVLPRAQSWGRYLELARHLEFQQIKERVGLPTAALVAFLIGIACGVAAVLVGFIFSANTVLDWQAVQVWRIQWLLGSAAAFLAGILLNRR